MVDIPRAPGVPSLAAFAESAIILLVADVVGAILSQPPQWGIFRDGVAVIAADNTVSFEQRQDNPVSTYPVEPNSFLSYNKVQLAADVRVSMSCGGSISARQAFLASVDANLNTTDLYDVLTPEQVYSGYNFTHKDLRRTSRNGATLIVVDLWMTQIRDVGTSNFANTAQPGDAGVTGNGNVQPVEAPANVQSLVGSAGGGGGGGGGGGF